MENQIQLYHDLTAFYLSTEQQLQAEIASLRQQTATLEQRLKEGKVELKAVAKSQYSLGYENGNKQGNKEGYNRGYQEAIDKAELVYEPEDLADGKLNIEKAHQRGWLKARKLYLVTYPCCRCRKIIEVSLKNEKEAIKECMKHWGHRSCLEKKHGKCNF